MAAMAPEEMDAWGEVPNLGEEVILCQGKWGGYSRKNGGFSQETWMILQKIGGLPNKKLA